MHTKKMELLDNTIESNKGLFKLFLRVHIDFPFLPINNKKLLSINITKTGRKHAPQPISVQIMPFELSCTKSEEIKKLLQH